MPPFVPGPVVITSARVADMVWPLLAASRNAALRNGERIDAELGEWLDAIAEAAAFQRRRGSATGSARVPPEPKRPMPVRELQTMTSTAAAEVLEVSPRAVTKRAEALGGWRQHGDHGPWLFDADRIAQERTRRTHGEH